MELGSEKTPQEHVERMVAVFREVRRVLRDDGLCWVNYGETYNAYNNNRGSSTSISGNNEEKYSDADHGLSCPGLAPLQRVGIPERFALAMQADGWLWRDTIIWHKRSPMPASLSGTAWVRCRVKIADNVLPAVCDRNMMAHERPQTNLVGHKGDFADNGRRWSDCPGCDKCRDTGGYVLRRGSWRTTPAHEYIFLFAQKAGYFADQEGVKEPCASSTIEREKYTRVLDDPDEQFAVVHDHESASGGMRNPRSVMSFKRFNLSEKHYAAFPPALAEFCVRASTSPKGVCQQCGAQWARVIDRTDTGIKQKMADGWDTGAGAHGNIHRDGREQGEQGKPVLANVTIGYRPTCQCNAGDPIPATVLDPFGGSGTTGLVADRLGHDAILIELNPDYHAMAKRRITKDAGIFADVS
jgi:DNA modification methylase